VALSRARRRVQQSHKSSSKPWSREEDALIMEHVQNHGARFTHLRV